MVAAKEKPSCRDCDHFRLALDPGKDPDRCAIAHDAFMDGYVCVISYVDTCNLFTPQTRTTE